MNNLKKQIVAISASMLLSSAAYAQSSGWEVDGNIGIVSDYILAGRTMSNNNPSLNLGVNATHNWFFAGAQMNTIQSDFFGRLQAEWIPEVGVANTFGEVDVYLVFRLYRYTGGTLWTGDRASSWNADELGIGGSWNGWYTEIARLVRVKEGSKNTLFILGREHAMGDFVLDAHVNFQHYDTPSKTRFTNFQLTGSYNFRGVEPYVGFTLGGREADNSSIHNRVFFGIRYSF